MKHFLKATALATAAFVLAISGCKPPEVTPPIQFTASLRVVNYAPHCSVPLDVYWYPVGGQRAKQANVYYLQYGGAAVYTTSIPVNQGGTPYVIEIHPTNDSLKTFLNPTETFKPGGKYTMLVTLKENDPNTYVYKFVEDSDYDATAATNQESSIRFINMQEGSGNLELHVNDPVTGDSLGGDAGAGFLDATDYKNIKVATDQGFTLFLTAKNSTKILSRLGYQTFVSGNHYTIIYAGDTCRSNQIADSTTQAVDRPRLRNLDDNTGGSDLSNPVQPSFRYNIINGINFPSDQYTGYVINGEGFPQYGGFSTPPIGALAPGGFQQSDGSAAKFDGSVWNVMWQSASIPSPLPADKKLDMRGSQTDQAHSTNTPIFDAKADITAIHTDSSFSLVVIDTVPPAPKNGVLPQPPAYVIPITDNADRSAVTIVYVAAIAPSASAKGSNAWSDMSVTTADGSVTDKPVFLSPAAPGRSATITYPATSPLNFSITGGIGKSLATLTPGNGGVPAQFTGQPGGIYEVVFVGTKDDSKILIIRVNSPNQ